MSADQGERKIQLEERIVENSEREARFSRRLKLLEIREQRKDRSLRESEIKNSHGSGIKFTPAQATVAAAALAVASAIVGGLIQAGMARDVEMNRSSAQMEIERLRSQATIDLEKEKQSATDRINQAKFETTLILKAIEAEDRETQILNLKFFLKAGFISDPDGKISSMSDTELPSLTRIAIRNPIRSSEEIAHVAKSSIGRAKVILNDESDQYQTTAIFVGKKGFGLIIFRNPEEKFYENNKIKIELPQNFPNKEFSAKIVLIFKIDEGPSVVLFKIAKNISPVFDVSYGYIDERERHYIAGLQNSLVTISGETSIDLFKDEYLINHAANINIGDAVINNRGELAGIIYKTNRRKTGGNNATYIICERHI